MARPTPRGFTIVELLVGLALGLLVTAAAASLVLTHLREHRALWLQSRLMQDLRVAADMVTRELRRAGYWSDATVATANPHATFDTSAVDTVYSYSHDTPGAPGVDAGEQLGFRLRHGAIEMMLGRGNWQALTDSGSVSITAFTVTPDAQELPLQGFCSKPCPADVPGCGPKQVVRSLAVLIRGRSIDDATVARTVTARVRLRNDTIVGACPT